MRNLTVLLKVLQHSFSKKGEVALDFAGIDFLSKKKIALNSCTHQRVENAQHYSII